MKVDDIRDYCLTFPNATETLQWGDDLCFKIRGKIFAIVGLDNPRLCFKCHPEIFAELIEREDLRPAPYVGRYKWVMADRLDALNVDETKDLIRQSFEMVVAKAPKTFNKKKIAGKVRRARQRQVKRKTRKR
jgi:predicted DNA-binding protein (MmcQ/YjbR family)